jgi:hypothetical protein
MELIPLQRYWMSVLFLACALLLVHFLLDIAKTLSGNPSSAGLQRGRRVAP